MHYITSYSNLLLLPSTGITTYHSLHFHLHNNPWSTLHEIISDAAVQEKKRIESPGLSFSKERRQHGQ